MFLMGRELFISNVVWDFDPFGQSNWSSASLVRGRNWPPSSNNLSYQSPKIAGFDFYNQYALSNTTSWTTGTSGQGREAGAQVTYAAPLFQVRGIYDEIHNPANGQLGGSYGTTATASTPTRANTLPCSICSSASSRVQGGYQAIRSSGMTNLLPGQPSRSRMGRHDVAGDASGRADRRSVSRSTATTRATRPFTRSAARTICLSARSSISKFPG